ncbi:hypothetical protein GQ600_25702 [Phytophthora cactorum]|nr:hypothetical protein GQ600_25702 [Phytophthora cactorum]
MKIAFYLALLVVTISSTVADFPVASSRKLMCALTPGSKTNCCNDIIADGVCAVPQVSACA